MASSPTTTLLRTDHELSLVPQRDALSHALEQSEERFQQLVERIAVGVFRASANGRLVEVNPSLPRMLGYEDENELCAVDIARDIFDDPLVCENLWAHAARSAIDRLAVRWKRKDGSSLAIRLSMRAVPDEHGRVVFYDGIVDDVSDLLRQQELLRRTERMASLGATLAGVAHELNNPLAAILGFAQLLLKKDVDSEARLALETIDHEAGRAGKIVRDLLTLARKREVDRRVRVNLNDVVGYIVGTRRYALETHGIACVANLDPHLSPVVGDRTQLEQVVLNLLNNAEQAIRSAREDGGEVRIRTRVEGSSAVLEVEDDGPGVPDDNRDQIWDAFWTTKGIGAGTGLGLTVVRDIVSSHGGEIAIAVPIGGDVRDGARFVVRLPALHCRSAHDFDVLDQQATRALDVLVVDSNTQNTAFLAAFLSSRGHAALTASDIGYALHLADHLPFDAVICDSSIANGNAELGALRAAPGCLNARFIVAAGDAKSMTRLTFPLPPATGLVMRPYDLEELRLLLED